VEQESTRRRPAERPPRDEAVPHGGDLEEMARQRGGHERESADATTALASAGVPVAEAVAWPVAGNQAQRSGVCGRQTSLATENSAARRGQTLSERCRQVLLDAAAGPARAPEAEAILSEILALLKFVINPNAFACTSRYQGRAYVTG
jgi:hypothetical protein